MNSSTRANMNILTANKSWKQWQLDIYTQPTKYRYCIKKKFCHNRLAVAISDLKQHENSVIYISRIGYNTCVVTVRQFYTGYATIAIELRQQSKLTGLVRFHGYWYYWGGGGGGGRSSETYENVSILLFCYLCLVTSVGPLDWLRKQYEKHLVFCYFKRCCGQMDWTRIDTHYRLISMLYVY